MTALLSKALERHDPGGLFTAAARAFLAARGAHVSPGPEGIRTLTAMLLDHVTEDDGSGDDAFVEGCGAALGLLLADAYGGATRSKGERHLILVGRHGSVDPFGMIRRALEAVDPRDALARELEEAELEARGEGPTACAVLSFALALAEAGAEASIAERFGLEVTLDDGTEVDLTRVRHAGDAAPVIARRLARTLTARAASIDELAELEERILPRVVGDAFLDRLGDSARALAFVTVAQGLHLGLIAHYGDRARFLRRNELDDGPRRLDEIRALALARLAERSTRLAFVPDGEVLQLATRDGLDASRILLPNVSRALESALGGPAFVAAPHRDVLLASRDRARLEAIARDAFLRAPHGVSPHVYRFEGGRVTSLG